MSAQCPQTGARPHRPKPGRTREAQAAKCLHAALMQRLGDQVSPAQAELANRVRALVWQLGVWERRQQQTGDLGDAADLYLRTAGALVRTLRELGVEMEAAENSTPSLAQILAALPRRAPHNGETATPHQNPPPDATGRPAPAVAA